MKNLALIIFLFSSLFCFTQKEKKETVYLLYDTTNNDKCIVEDGSGNSQKLNKYRKECEGELTYLYICNEAFAFNTIKKQIDTSSVEALSTIKFVDLEYIKNKKSENVMKYNPFEKIYLVEKISKEKIVKYDVTWINDWVMVRD